MKILINTVTTHKGGSVQVAYSFLQECKKMPQYQFIVVLGLTLQKLVNTEEYPSNFTFEKISYRPAQRVLSFEDQAKALKKVEKQYHPDVVFTTSGPAYWRPKVKHLMGYNLAHYIYKDSPFYKTLSLKEKMFWFLKGRIIKYYTKRDADAYVVQTEDVNKRLQEWIGVDKVFTVSNTYGTQFEKPEIKKSLLPPKIDNEFRLLLLSSYYKHKHIEIIKEIIGYFSDEESIRFITTLPNNVFKSIFTQKETKFIYNVGPISPNECPGLFTECQAVFLPTLLECFSATYAEAMKMKIPIITTDLGFAHTVCGKAALYFEPMNAVDAFEKVKQLQNDRTLYESLLKKATVEIRKFNSAEKRAQQFIQICEEISGKD